MARVESESRDYLASASGQGADNRVILILVTAAVVLILHQYVPFVDYLLPPIQWLYEQGFEEFASNLFHQIWVWDNVRGGYRSRELFRVSYWALFCFITYFFIPWFVIRVFFKQKLADYGFKLRGAFADWWVYVVFFAIMGPILLWVSTHKHFQEVYPFFKIAKDGDTLWPAFWIWEVCYFLQFIGLEFFFRGFILHGLKHRFGAYAIFVMMVPYCMIHFEKPMLESIAAILAGIALGFMSLKTRSIFLGAAIHMTVALSMDFLSLWRQGYFG